MVGQTTAKQNPRNLKELEAEFRQNLRAAKIKKAELGKQMLELEKAYAAADAEEDIWDSALYSLQNMGVQSGPKYRRKEKDRNGKEIVEEEEEWSEEK